MHDFTARTLLRTLPVTAVVAFLVLTVDALVQRDVLRIGVAISLAIVVLASRRRGRAQPHNAAALRPEPAPQVASMLHGGSADVEGEMSIVCADIRNFTRFTAHTPSADVMRFLREYYDAVGQAVAAHGGTIKDYAGDGVLVLVGAPTPMDDHAERAVAIAAAIRDAVLAITQSWSSVDLPLGVGVGVASGTVTVGVVGSRERREFAAVGSAVNLAARLCSKAAAGQILLDSRTCELTGPQDGAAQIDAPLRLKGFDAPVAGFAL